MSKLEIVLNQYTELTVINVNGKLYVKSVSKDAEVFMECKSIHIALDEDGLINNSDSYAPACDGWQNIYGNINENNFDFWKEL